MLRVIPSLIDIRTPKSFLYERADVPYYTNVTIFPTNITYGTLNPGDAFKTALSGVCGGTVQSCDTAAALAANLSVPSKFYQGIETQPASGNIVFTVPDATFEAGDGTYYVEAMAAIASAVSRSQVLSWSFEEAGLKGVTPVDSSGTNTYYSFADQITIVRRAKADNSIQDSMTVNAAVEIDPNPFTWCNILDVASLVSGAFNGALGSFFGAGALICHAETGSK